MFKLASWNVNSLKVRLEHILTWLDSTGIDVLALQETKLIDDHFPLNVFSELGYHAIYAGQKSYNGVAIISRFPMSNTLYEIPGLEDPQRRILVTNIGDLRLINLYVPNGSHVNSDKYHYKLDWIKKVTAFINEQVKSYPLLAVVGDFNIAPEDIDVHDPAEWEGCVLVSPQERQAFKELLGLGLTDSVRHHFREEQLFSWWDYRAANFRRNRGVRIDHILLSNALKRVCIQSKIDKDPRKWDRPSDHAPVWVELQYELNPIRHAT